MSIRVTDAGYSKLAGLLLTVLPALLLSQTRIVTHSAGYTQSGVSQTVLMSTAGQVLFVGSSQNSTSRIESGSCSHSAQQEPALAVGETGGLPMEYDLRQNYPNPFNPSTTIPFDLPVTTEVHLMVYDLLGREVARLVGEHLPPGYHRIPWNGKDQEGRELPAGIYIARLVTHSFNKSLKMVLLR